MRQEDADRLREKIESRTGAAIADLRFFAAGQNADLYIVDLDDRRRLMAKTMRLGDAAPPNVDLEVEGWMLYYLTMKSKLPVPRVYWYDPTTMLMDYIPDEGPMNDTVANMAAMDLAAMHSITSKFYGLERDTSVGSFRQPNHFETSWLTFFRDHRLLHMAREALNDNTIDASLMYKIEKLAGRLDQYLGNTSIPGLVHGDLWEGNIILGAGRVKAFLDPAIYYADPEIELAAIHVLGTFGEAFFQRYNEIRPIQPGFAEVRRDIYALYPLLIQGRLGYRDQIEQVQTIVDRLIG